MGRVSPGSATSVTVGSVSITGDVAVTNAGLTELAAAINGSSQIDVNIAASGATVPVSGTFWQATQPVSLTSTTVTGTVAVTQSGTWDEVGINDSGNSITVDQSTASNLNMVAWGWDGAANRAVATDSSGNLQVDVLSGTIDLGATDNAVLDAIAASVAAIDTDATTIIGHVDGLEALIGTTNTNTAASTTALQLIDNAVSGAGFNITQLGGVNVSMNTGVRDTGTQRMTIATDDLVPIKIASGQVNSGAIASGAVASGAFASGSIGSGAIASGAVASGAIAAGAVAAGAYVSGSILSGALASGAVVDLTNVSMPITPATATATKTLGLGAEYRSTLPTWTNTQQGALQVGTRGALHVELWNSNSATVNPVGSGTATGALRVELPTNGTGIVGLAAGTNGIGKLTSNTGVTIGAVEIATAQTLATVTTVSTLTGGGIAHDSADSGNPHKIGFIAYSPDGTTPGTAVAELDRSNAKSDLDGRQYVNDEHPRWGSYHVDGSAALTDATVAASPGAGFQTVITNICVSSGAATAMNMFLEEGATKIFGPIYLEAVAGRGFCTPAGFKKHVTAATAVTITTSAAIAHSVDIQYITQAV